MLILLTYNITLTVEHIPGKDNNICDLLSRQQVSAAMLKHAGGRNKNTDQSLARKLGSIRESLIRNSVTPATHRSYSKSWEDFLCFKKALYGHDTVTVTNEGVCNYIAHLSSKGFRESTIRTHLAGIKFMAGKNIVELTSDSYMVNRLLEGVKKQHNAKQLQPITRQILHDMLDNVGYVTTNDYERKLLSALVLIIMYHGCLRVGESLISGLGEHTLKWKQIQIVHEEDAQYLKIMFKHYRPGGINTVWIKSSLNKRYCPVQAFAS